MAIYELKGFVQHYAWGGMEFIPNLLNIENDKKKPFAELWMGTHAKGPASVLTPQGNVLLKEFIKKAPKNKLGKQVANYFDNQLPFLFKVLDVRKMLSIQAHPTKKEAEKGFAKENKTGIPITAPNRTYRDANHKPEVMVALTDFWLLHGFKSIKEIKAVLNIPEFQILRKYFKNKSIFNLYKIIMEMPQVTIDAILTPLWKRLRPEFEKGNLEKGQADFWAAQAFMDYTIGGHYDRGIFSIYLFNLVNLKKGTGIFQAAGIPHAYLEGVNMELMANSDNVFRGGLTQKHMNTPELLKQLIFESVTPKILKGETISSVEKIYQTPAPDFELSQINLSKTTVYQIANCPTAEILITLSGTGKVTANEKISHFQKGTIFFIEAYSGYQITSENDCWFFKAKVPV